MTTLDNDKSYYEKIISQVKRELCIQRQVAVDRRSKKSKRECQYNKISWVPCFSILYLRKYKKARDRLAMADQAVVDANNTLIAYRASLHEKINSMYCLQTEKENIEDKIKKTVEDVGSLKKLAAQLSESDDFWRDFYTYHIKFTSETVKDLIEIFRTGSSKNHEHSIKAFKISCLEYGEAEAYGNSRWSHLQVDYNCSDCGVNHTGWPILDIKTEHGLLCSVCGSHAQESRISVVSFSSKKSAQSTMNSKKNFVYQVKPRLTKMIKRMFPKSIPHGIMFSSVSAAKSL
ncbi:hypothetical protein BDF14DRAFT_1238825 [Spinellus fusiger]|nr:hypothetical protein BDF14DRAFT_1238825 [Spinellus fusiger]